MKSSTLIAVGIGAVAVYLLFLRKPATHVAAPGGLGAPAAPQPLPGQVQSANPWAAIASQIVGTVGSYLQGGPSSSSSSSAMPELLNQW